MQLSKSKSSDKKDRSKKQCDKHKESELVGVCTVVECGQSRVLVCYDCIYEMHSEHSNKVLIFKQLESNQKEAMDLMMNDKKVYEIYQNILEYRVKYANDIKPDNIKEDKSKEDYKLRLRSMLSKLQQQIEDKIDQTFDQNNNKSLYLVDQLFQKHYPLSKVVDQFNKLVNSNQADMQIKLVIESVDSILTNQQDNNRQIQELAQQDDLLMTEQYLDRLMHEIESTLLANSQKLVQTISFIESPNQHGFVILMKLCNDDMHFNNQMWTRKGLSDLKQASFSREEWTNSQVYTDYYDLNVKQILLECWGVDGKVRYSLLQKSLYRPLIAEFQINSCQSLRYVQGEKDPLQLMGVDLNNIKLLDNPWRINSQQANTNNNFKLRLGCFFTLSNSVFLKDSLNNICSHELAGLGISDDYYKNSHNRHKSAGIRQFNNQNTFLFGQYQAKINLYAR